MTLRTMAKIFGISVVYQSLLGHGKRKSRVDLWERYKDLIDSSNKAGKQESGGQE